MTEEHEGWQKTSKDDWRWWRLDNEDATFQVDGA